MDGGRAWHETSALNLSKPRKLFFERSRTIWERLSPSTSKHRSTWFDLLQRPWSQANSRSWKTFPLCSFSLLTLMRGIVGLNTKMGQYWQVICVDRKEGLQTCGKLREIFPGGYAGHELERQLMVPRPLQWVFFADPNDRRLSVTWAVVDECHDPTEGVRTFWIPELQTGNGHFRQAY